MGLCGIGREYGIEILLEVVGGEGGNVGMCWGDPAHFPHSSRHVTRGILSVLALPVGDGQLCVLCFHMLDFPGIQPGESGIMVQEQSQISLGCGSSSFSSSFQGHWSCHHSTSAPRMGFF